MEKNTDFYVRLVSSDCLDLFPGNTLLSFSNTLSPPLHIPRAEGWKVALHEITCHNEFSSGNKLSLVKIKCDQLSPDLGTEKYLSFHTRIPYNNLNNRVHQFNPKNHEYFFLNSDNISELSIHIEGRFAQFSVKNINKTKIDYGEPTIILLHFKKFSMSNAGHIIRVSNLPRTIDEGTTQLAQHFFTTLPNTLELQTNNQSERKWKVALLSVNFDKHFVTHRYLQPLKVVFSQRGVQKIVSSEPKISKFDTNQQVVDYFNFLLQNLKVEKSVERDVITSNSPPSLAPTTVQNSSESTELSSNAVKKIKNSDSDSEDGEIVSNELENNILQENNLENESLNRNKRSSGRKIRLPLTVAINFQNKCEIIFYRTCSVLIPYDLGKVMGCGSRVNSDGYFEISGFKNQQIVFQNPINLGAVAPNALLLYTNFIRPSHMGSMLSPILKTIPITNIDESNFYSTYECENLEFHELSQTSLTNLEFQMLQIDGKPVKFFNPYHEMYYTLLFKEM